MKSKSFTRLLSLVLAVTMVISQPVTSRASSFEEGAANAASVLTSTEEVVTEPVDENAGDELKNGESGKDESKQGELKTEQLSDNEAGDEKSNNEESENEESVVVEKQTVSVIFDGNGGFFDEGADQVVAQITQGETLAIDIAIPSLEGSRFIGWSLDKESTEVIDPASYQVNSDITVYAVWEVEQLQIEESVRLGAVGDAALILDANGGTFPDGSSIYETPYYYGYIGQEGMVPTRSGYALTGWYFDKECKQLASNASFSSLFSIGENIAEGTVLYAGWTNSYYTVTFDATETGLMYKNSDKTGEALRVRTVLIPTNANSLNRGLHWYVDVAWYQSEFIEYTGSGAFSFKNWKLPNGKIVYNIYNYVPTSNVTFIAVYNPSITLTFDANGGKFPDKNDDIYRRYYREYNLNPEETIFSETVPEGSELDSWEIDENRKPIRNSYFPPEPAKEGTVFEGWYLDGVKVTEKDFGNLPSNRDYTFVAHYSEPRKVTFNALNGTIYGGSTKEYGGIIEGQKFGNFYAYPEEPVSNDSNMTFEGWYRDEALTEKADKDQILGTVVNEDIVFYAKYVPTFTVTFYANGGAFKNNAAATVAVKVGDGMTIGTKAPTVTGADSAVFNGWYTDPECKTTAINVYKYKVTSNISLYAGFKADGYYTITFNAGQEGVSFKEGGSQITVKTKKGQPMTYGTGDAASINASPAIDFNDAAKATGLRPSGYWIGSDGNRYYFSDAEKMLPHESEVIKNGEHHTLPAKGFVPSSDMTFTAEWVPYVKVVFKADEGYYFYGSGTRKINGEELSYEEDLYLESNDKGSHCTEAVYYAAKGSLLGPIISLMPRPYDTLDKYISWGFTKDGKAIPSNFVLENDIEVHAKAQKTSVYKPVQINFHTMDGYFKEEYGNYVTKTITIPSTSIGMAANYSVGKVIPNNDDYIFAGWFYDKDCKKPYTYTKYLYNGEESVYFPQKVTDLYAGYVKAIKVRFDANGGYFDEKEGVYTQNPSDEIKNNYLETIKAAPGKPVNAGSFTARVRHDSNKVFAGWYLDEECTVKAKTAIEWADGYEVYRPSESVTLFAKWVDKQEMADGPVLGPKEIKLDIGGRNQLSISPDVTEDDAVEYLVSEITIGKANKYANAPVKVDSYGYVTGQAEGTALVYAIVNGVTTNTVKVTVSSKAVASSLNLSTSETTLRTGDKAQIKAIVAPETLENAPFTWTSSNPNVVKVSGNTTVASIEAVAPGTAVITSKTGKVTNKTTITVVDAIVSDVKEVYLTNYSFANEVINLTVKGHSEEDSDVSVSTVYGENGAVSDFVKVWPGTTVYSNGVRTFSFIVSPNAVGSGKIHFETAKGYPIDVNVIVSDKLRAQSVVMTGADSYEGDENLDGEVTNGQKIYLASATRGADIHYAVEYSAANDFDAVDSQSLNRVYDGPITMSTGFGTGYVRISAYVSKETLSDSAVVSKIFRIDNTDSWLDVIDDDKDLFGDDVENVATSGLVVGHLPENIVYTTQNITFTEDELRVYYNGRMLQSGKDYKVAYKNNKAAVEVPSDLTALTKAQLGKLPKVTITATGQYSGSAERYFEIEKAPIAKALITSNMTVTTASNAFRTAPVPTVKYEIGSTGNFVNLKAGTDYTVSYYRIGEDGKVDYTKAVTANDIKADIKEGKYYSYLMNFAGKGNFEGVYDQSETGTRASVLQIISAQQLREGVLQLSNAKLSKKVPNLAYSEDAAGNAVVLSKNVIRMIESGNITIKIGAKVLNYVPDENSDEITEEGYYFAIDDPADADNSVNRYPGNENYIILRATQMPEGKEDLNKLVGSNRITFAITGTAINVRYVKTSAAYSGTTVLAYNGEEIDKAQSLVNLFDNSKNAVKAGAVSAEVYKKVAKDTFNLSPDYFDITVKNDNTEPGTVVVTFKGVREKGTTGTITKNVKVQARKIAANDNALNVAFGENVNPANVPYSKAGAKPEVIVSYAGEILTENVDYTLAYSGNTKVGAIAKVTVKLKGRFSGTISNVLSFTVGKAPFDTDVISIESVDKNYNARAAKNYFKSVPVLYDNGKKLALKSDYTYVTEPRYEYAEDLIEKDKDGVVVYARYAGTVIPDNEIVHAGALIKVSFTATPAAKSSYKALTDGNGVSKATYFETTYRIGAANISGYSVSVKEQKYANGKAVVPSKADITVKKGKEIVSASDYEIVSVTNNTNIGTATLVIRGNGKFCGTKKVTFKIVKNQF